MLTLNFKLIDTEEGKLLLKYDEVDGTRLTLDNPNKINFILNKEYDNPISLEWANPGSRDSLDPPTLYLDTNVMKSKEDFIHSIKNILCDIRYDYIMDKYNTIEFKNLENIYEKLIKYYWDEETIAQHNMFGKCSLDGLESLLTTSYKDYKVTTIQNREGGSPDILCQFPNTRLVIFKDPVFLNTDVKNKDISGVKVGFILGFVEEVYPEVNIRDMDVIPLFVVEMDIYKKYNYYTSSHIDNIQSTGRMNREWKFKLKHFIVKALNDRIIEVNFTSKQKDFWIMNHSIYFGKGSKKVSILCEKANFKNPHKFRFTVSKLGESKEFTLDPKNNKGTEKYPNTLSEFFSYVCSIIEYNEDYSTFLNYFQVFIGDYSSNDLGVDISKNISKLYPSSRGGNVMLNNGYILDKLRLFS